MRGVTGRVVKGWREYWSRRSYQRLSERRRRKRRMRWRMRVGPKMRIGGKAKSMVVWMRDAYKRMMMGLAVSLSGVRGMGGGADAVVGNPSLKEYDPAVILHIYNSLLPPPPSLPPDL